MLTGRKVNLCSQYFPQIVRKNLYFVVLIIYMQNILSSQYHHSSVSIRITSHNRMKKALSLLRRHDILLSESEIYRRLLNIYLRFWRGRAGKSATARRYNTKGVGFVIRPWYVNRVLYSVAWERSMHSGESVSRMLDFAIRRYLPRLVKGLISTIPNSVADSDYEELFGQLHFGKRNRNPFDFFINYSCRTETNQSARLRYVQETTLVPKYTHFIGHDTTPAPPNH